MNKLMLFLTSLIVWYSVLGMANGRIINCYYSNPNLLHLHTSLGICTHFTQYHIVKFNDDKTFTINENTPASMANYSSQYTFFAGILIREFEVKQIKDDRTRANFVNNVFELVHGQIFRGVDLKLHFVEQYKVETQRNSSLVKLIKELSKKLKPYKYKLSISVYAGAGTAHMNFNIPCIINHVSFINVKAYGFAEYSTNKLVYNAPNRGQGKNNTRSVMKDLIKKGIPAKKLILGIPFHGVSKILLNPKQFKVGSLTKSKLKFKQYRSICKLKNELNYTWDSEYETAVLLSGNNFISYDNVQSIKQKVNFGKCLGLAGFMVSFLKNDDFAGRCGDKYPLLRAVHNQLNEPLQSNDCLKYDF